MTVYVVIREDQNDHGFVDVSIIGLFRSRPDAEAVVESSCAAARSEGLLVLGDSGAEEDWDVAWSVQSHPLT